MGWACMMAMTRPLWWDRVLKDHKRLQCPFSLQLLWDIAVTMVKRAAYCDESGNPPGWIYEGAWGYILDVSISHGAVEETIGSLQSNVAQVLRPPPDSWLEQVEVGKWDWIQEKVDLYVVIDQSLLDCCLLLANAIEGLGLEPRQCRMKNVLKALEIRGPALDLVRIALTDLQALLLPSSDLRHHYVHRGIRPRMGTYAAIQRLETTTAFLGVGLEGVTIDREGAVTELAAKLDRHTKDLKGAAETVVESLAPSYTRRLEALGGIPPFTQAELTQAGAMLEYFQGADYPEQITRGQEN